MSLLVSLVCVSCNWLPFNVNEPPPDMPNLFYRLEMPSWQEFNSYRRSSKMQGEQAVAGTHEKWHPRELLILSWASSGTSAGLTRCPAKVTIAGAEYKREITSRWSIFSRDEPQRWCSWCDGRSKCISHHLAECTFKIFITSEQFSTHPHISTKPIVNGRLAERSNHSSTSLDRSLLYFKFRIQSMWSDTGGKSQGSQKEIAVESIDWWLRGILIVVRWLLSVVAVSGTIPCQIISPPERLHTFHHSCPFSVHNNLLLGLIYTDLL